MGESFPVALSKCLDSLHTGILTYQECLDRYPEHSQALAPLLRVATQITYLPYNSPGEQYQKESRARIIKQVRASKHLHKNRHMGNKFANVFSKAPAFAALVVFLFVVFFGGNQVAYAASASLPGDSLYKLKTSFEDAQLYVADDAQDVVLHMQFAETRLVEVQELANLKRYGNIEMAVEGFERHMELAFKSLETVVQQDPVKGIEITEFVAEKSAEDMDILSALAVTVPSDSQPFIQQALFVAVQFSGTQDNDTETPEIKNVPPVSISDEAEPSDDTSGSESEPTPEQAGKPENPGNSGTNNGNGSPDEPGNSENAGNPPEDPGTNGNNNSNNGNGNDSDNGNNGNGNNNDNGNDNKNNGNGSDNGNDKGNGK
ncbi:MAG TPA: DUF5667 domain-containing protein [Anaerolineales bacterium]|nr:DUF5667 domain-containing protein [Anaerolineales bacterium]